MHCYFHFTASQATDSILRASYRNITKSLLNLVGYIWYFVKFSSTSATVTYCYIRRGEKGDGGYDRTKSGLAVAGLIGCCGYSWNSCCSFDHQAVAIWPGRRRFFHFLRLSARPELRHICNERKQSYVQYKQLYMFPYTISWQEVAAESRRILVRLCFSEHPSSYSSKKIFEAYITTVPVSKLTS